MTYKSSYSYLKQYLRIKYGLSTPFFGPAAPPIYEGPVWMCLAFECVNDGPFLGDLMFCFWPAQKRKSYVQMWTEGDPDTTEWLAKRLTEHAESLGLVSLSNLTVK